MPELLIPIGIMAVVSGVWWIPRQMRRLRARVGADGNPERFEAMLQSRTYRYALMAITLGGTAAVVGGLILIIVGE